MTTEQEPASTALAERSAMAPVSAEEQAEVLEQVVIHGDLVRLTPPQRVMYYRQVCDTLGLNPFTRPFEYISLNGRLTLYPRRDATDQLRRNHRINVTGLERSTDADTGIHSVVAHGVDRHGRQDSALGAVSIKGLAGEGLANAYMKAETKAKRRLTLSLAGLGMFDEAEIEGIDDAIVVRVDPVTGEITDGQAAAARPVTGLLEDALSRARAARGATEDPQATAAADTASDSPEPTADTPQAAEAPQAAGQAAEAADPLSPDGRTSAEVLAAEAAVPVADAQAALGEVVQGEAVVKPVPGQQGMFEQPPEAKAAAKPARKPARKPKERQAADERVQQEIADTLERPSGEAPASPQAPPGLNTWVGAIRGEVAEDSVVPEDTGLGVDLPAGAEGLRLVLALDQGTAQVALHGKALDAFYALDPPQTMEGERLQVAGVMRLVPWSQGGVAKPPYRRIVATDVAVAP